MSIEKTEPEIQTLLTKRIVRIIGFRRGNCVEASYILMSDKKTFIELKEQDYYAYHDCSSSARNITVQQDKERWKLLNENDALSDATRLI
jgi:hypothetical protein